MYNLWCEKRIERKACSVCNNKGDCRSENEEVICPATKRPLKVMGEDTNLRAPSSWSNKPREVKNKELMKRSQQHFEREIKPQYQELNPKKKKK